MSDVSGCDWPERVPSGIPTGCSDAYLNFLKNQTPAAGTGISRYITQASIRTLDANTPAGITTRNHADFAAILSGPGIREGNIVGLVGYLYFVQRTGAESTNCGLTGAGQGRRFEFRAVIEQ